MWFNTSQTQQYIEGEEGRDRRAIDCVINLETIGARAKTHAVLSVTAIIGVSVSLHYVSFVLR